MSAFRRDRDLIFLPLNVLDVARYVVNYGNERFVVQAWVEED